MILENYNGALKENIETGLSFTVNELPLLEIRPFDSRVYRDEGIVIPYFVDDYLNTSYEENKLTNTFTVVVSLDEDTRPESEVNQYYRWKLTTYAGEHVIMCPLTNENVDYEGEHTLSIKAIEDNGIASDTKFFKIYISKPKADISLFDIPALFDLEIYSFSAHSVDRERMEVPFWFLMPDSGNGYIPVVLHPDDANKGNYSPIVAVKRDLTYNVTFHSDGQGGFTSVDVRVQGVIDVPKYTAKNKGGGLNKTYNATRIQMNGTYYITDSVETNNETILLRDFLSTAMEVVVNSGNASAKRAFADATCIAGRNKIGIQYLLWACKAYCNEHNYDGVILPKHEYIITYANGLDPNDTTNNAVLTTAGDYAYDAGPLSAQSRTVGGNKGRGSRNDIRFPNKLIIDFNYSSVKSLSCPVDRGDLIHIAYGYLTEIRNLEVVGDYRTSSWPVTSPAEFGETRRGVLVHRCKLCTLDNINVHGTVGYELSGKNGNPGDSYVDHDYKCGLFVEPTFNEDGSIKTGGSYGYIDYEGHIVSVPPLKTNRIGYLDNYDTNPDTLTYDLLKPIIDSVTNPNESNLIIDFGVSNVMYTPDHLDISALSKSSKIEYAGFSETDKTPYDSAFEVMTTFSNRTDGFVYSLGNARDRADGMAIFLSFYNENDVFVKTIKIRPWDIGYVPYGAKYVRFSAIGCLDQKNYTTRLNQKDDDGNLHGAFWITSRKYWERANNVVNSLVHDIRSCTVLVGGQQCYFNNFITYSTAAERKSNYGELTEYLLDVEDMRMHNYHMWFTEWHNIYGSNRTLHLLGGNDICIIGCSGINIDPTTLVKGGLIALNVCSMGLYPPNIAIQHKNTFMRNTLFTTLTRGSASGSQTSEYTYYLKDCVIVKLLGSGSGRVNIVNL